MFLLLQALPLVHISDSTHCQKTSRQQPSVSAAAGIAIGGDVFPGSTLSDHCLRYQNIPDIKLIVVLGELGGHDEYSLVDALTSGQINKPVVAWVSGTCAKLFKSEVQFGHAGAKSGGASESAQVSQLRVNFACRTCRNIIRSPPKHMGRYSLIHVDIRSKVRCCSHGLHNQR